METHEAFISRLSANGNRSLKKALRNANSIVLNTRESVPRDVSVVSTEIEV